MKRRKFIENGAIATSAILTAPSLFAQNRIMGANDRLNVAVIGTGSRGTGLLSLIKEIPELKTIGCCDIIPFHLEAGLKLADREAKGYEDYRKLLEEKDIDAVFISTPFSEHAHMVMDALDAGKHVYCEKTMVKGIDVATKVAEKVESSTRVFQVGHQYHSSRLYTHVVDLIKEGQIGEISALNCQWNRNHNWRRPVPDPKWEKLINWRMYKEYSGGLVAELCSHQMDFTNWLLESEPDMITGFGGIDYWKDGRETFDNVHFICKYPSGVKASYTCLTTNSLGDYEIKVLGKKGTITLDYTKAWYYPEDEKERETGLVDGVSGATVKWDEQKGYPIEVNHKDPTLQAILDFRDNIVENKIPESNVHTAGRVAIMVQMALDAMEYNTIARWQREYSI